MSNPVVSVDPILRKLGEPIDLLAAHTAPGVCHLAVSVQLVDRDGRWLVAQRSSEKRSFAGLWSNTCCTHPFPGEDAGAAGKRRLSEELGVQVDDLELAGDFVYRAADPQSGFVEHEWDHVYVMRVDALAVEPNPDEVQAVRLITSGELDELLAGGDATPWFATVVKIAKSYLETGVLT